MSIDQTITDIRRLALIVKPKDMGTFSVDVLAGLPSEEDAMGTKYFETTFEVAKSTLETEEGIKALFEVAQHAMNDLLNGKVVLQEQ
jgi:hypothetical protein